MPVYTVYEPRRRGAEAPVDPERFVFVRDGFSFWAFLLGPVWMLLNRLWLVLLLYIIAMTVLGAGLWALGLSMGARFTVGLLVSLLVGLEAGTLRRWTCERRGWHNLGLVVADSVEAAERRFFDIWVTEQGRPLPPTGAPPPAPPVSGPVPAVIGLFPEPGVQR